MTAREYLERPRQYEKRVKSMMEKLDELKCSATNCTPGYGSDTVKHNRNVDGIYVLVMKIQNAEKQLDEEIDRLVDAKREVEDMLSTINSEAVRQTMRAVYLEYQTKVAAATQLGVTKRTVINRCNVGLAIIDQKLRETEYDIYCG